MTVQKLITELLDWPMDWVVVVPSTVGDHKVTLHEIKFKRTPDLEQVEIHAE